LEDTRASFGKKIYVWVVSASGSRAAGDTAAQAVPTGPAAGSRPVVLIYRAIGSHRVDIFGGRIARGGTYTDMLHGASYGEPGRRPTTRLRVRQMVHGVIGVYGEYIQVTRVACGYGQTTVECSV
jgi:hypothetical protein